MPHSGQTQPAGGSTGCCVLVLQALPAPDRCFVKVILASRFGMHLHLTVCAECGLQV